MCEARPDPNPYEKLVLSTAELAGVSTAILSKPIGNASQYREDTIAALDFMFFY